MNKKTPTNKWLEFFSIRLFSESLCYFI